MPAHTAVPPSAAPNPAEVAYARYDQTTSRWGRLTMLACLILSLAGPLYLVLGTDLDISGSQLLTAFAAVAAVFGVIWVVEVITYYPVLGPAATYQAFMIGNIANKLLPAAIVAQATIGAKPGTRRAELAAVMAICGAAIVHIVSLLVFVGILGTWLVSLMPESVIEVARLYIFPAIIGAVIVQLALYVRSVRILLLALGVAALVQLVLVPRMGTMFGNFATAIVVMLTVALAWFLRDRSARHDNPSTPDDPTQET
jgi:hypothetical protein